jgi:hypothetical protein
VKTLPACKHRKIVRLKLYQGQIDKAQRLQNALFLKKKKIETTSQKKALPHQTLDYRNIQLPKMALNDEQNHQRKVKEVKKKIFKKCSKSP